MVHLTSAVSSLSNNVIHTKPLSHTEEEPCGMGCFISASMFNLLRANERGASLSF